MYVCTPHRLTPHYIVPGHPCQHTLALRAALYAYMWPATSAAEVEGVKEAAAMAGKRVSDLYMYVII